MAGAAIVLSSCSVFSSPASSPDSSGSASGSSAPSSSASSSTAPTTAPKTSTAPSTTPLGAPVHISSDVVGDGSVVGIGMPLIIQFDRSINSARAFVKAATVTVNGRPAGGAWFFEKPYADEPMQAHYRPQSYWPAHSRVHVNLPVNRLSAGAGLSFANNLTLDYSIGASHVSIIDAQALTMKTYTDGKLVHENPVSLGASATPTFRGIKVVMEKNRNERMIGPGYNEIVPWSVRITSSGEFIHAAARNTNIGLASTSNGCTNLRTQDALWFFNYAVVGDLAIYNNAPGPTQPSWDGLGDWNLPWSVWTSGGLLHTT